MASMLKFLLLGFIMLVVSAQDVIPCEGEDDCCDGILCGINEGDCDYHEDCAGHLRCGVDNCDGPNFDSTDDCCWDDPSFPPPSPEEDFEMCEIIRGLEKKIAQAAVAQRCDLPEGRPESISFDECAEVSCSADLIGKSFTCNNQDNEKTCKGLLSLLDAMVMKKTTQCSQLLRTTTCNCSSSCLGRAATNCDANCGYCIESKGSYGCVSKIGNAGTSADKCFNITGDGTSTHPYNVTFNSANVTFSDLNSTKIPGCSDLFNVSSTSNDNTARSAHAGNGLYICRASPKLVISYENNSTTSSGPQAAQMAGMLATANALISENNNCIVTSNCASNQTHCAYCISQFPTTQTGCGALKNCSSVLPIANACTSTSSIKSCSGWTGTSYFPTGNTGTSYLMATQG